MTATGMQIDASLRDAYRATFEVYSRKLDNLQRLMVPGASDNGQIEAALFEVEKARIAHSYARDRLAGELVTAGLPPASALNAMSEGHIRETAQLLWELAGRPEGTAERDWRRAEQLVQRAATAAC